MKKLKMGMVGGGSDAFIGAVHRRAAIMDGEIELVAGALSSTPEKALSSGEEIGLEDDRNYGAWEDMLDRELALPEGERVDFVSIVTPNHMHFPVAHAFVEAGFNVVVDKPMVHNSEQAQRLINAVEKSGTVFAVTYNYTGYPMVKQARHMVATGAIGDIRKVIVEYSQGWLSTRAEEKGKQAEWRTDPKRSGIAGAIGDIGSHAENLLSTVTGLEISELCADLTTFVPGRRLEDDGNLLLRFENGARGILTASQVAAGEENNLILKVYGTEGGIEWNQEEPDYLSLKLAEAPEQILKRGNEYLCKDARDVGRIPPGHPEAFIEAFANVYRGIATAVRAESNGSSTAGVSEFPTVYDGARGVHFIEKVVESSCSDTKWTQARWEPAVGMQGGALNQSSS